MANEVKPGTYFKRPGGVEMVAQVRTYMQCGLCEFNTTDEDEMKDHAENPGLHKGGTPKLVKETEETRINEPGSGRTPAQEPAPLTDEEQAQVEELTKKSGDELEQMAVEAGVAKSGSKSEVASRLVVAKRG